LRDQLKNTQHQLKVITAKVDVALSKASRAVDAEKFELYCLVPKAQCWAWTAADA
jgi:hypothetical protein